MSRRSPRRSDHRGISANVAAPRPAAAVPTLATRISSLDNLRGFAILAMVAYHFCFDLQYFGVTQWDFYQDPVWLNARTMILSSFLLIAGMSMVLADRGLASHLRFWRHVGIIGACAVVISIASYAQFRESWIWFGVLHAIFMSLILARPLVRRPAMALIIGAIVIVAGNLFTHPLFDGRALGWLGFMTAKPHTEDYVPLFPWTGMLLLGIAGGHALVRTEFRPIAFAEKWPWWMAWLGRHSLAIYMVHQPLLIGLLLLVVGR